MIKKYSISIILVLIMIFNNPIGIAKESPTIIETKIVTKVKPKLPIPKTVVLKPHKNIKVKKSPVVKSKLITSSRGTTLNQDKVILLAKLIQSEALSESYEGKLWVGAVVINRMRVYKKSLSEVIYQRHQFDGTQTKLFKSEPSKSCMKAAIEVLNGNLVSREVLYFVDLNLCNPSWINDVERIVKIETHTFYREK